MKISIAMCTYNGQAFLGEQLESIAAQTRPPDEMVICDDNSNDTTVKMIETFASTASFPVRLYINSCNLGSTKNFEKAIDLCYGDLIALSDQDDVWSKHKLKKLEDTFSASPEVGLVFTDADLIDEASLDLNLSLWQSFEFDRPEQELIKRGKAFEVFIQRNVATGATMAFRSSLREFFLPIPSDLPYMIHDGWIALVASAVAQVALIYQPTIKYRLHSTLR